MSRTLILTGLFIGGLWAGMIGCSSTKQSHQSNKPCTTCMAKANIGTDSTTVVHVHSSPNNPKELIIDDVSIPKQNAETGKLVSQNKMVEKGGTSLSTTNKSVTNPSSLPKDVVLSPSSNSAKMVKSSVSGSSTVPTKSNPNSPTSKSVQSTYGMIPITPDNRGTNSSADNKGSLVPGSLINSSEIPREVRSSNVKVPNGIIPMVSDSSITVPGSVSTSNLPTAKVTQDSKKGMGNQVTVTETYVSNQKVREQYSHAKDYTWLIGKLEYLKSKKVWRMRYCSPDQEDPYGGCVNLTARDERLEAFKDGDFVKIDGKLINPESKINGSAYEVNLIHPIK